MKLSGPRSLNLPFYLLNILNMDPAMSWIPLQYLRRDPSTAGYLTHREAGYCVEIATEAALQASKNVWVDGSLRDSGWYTQVFSKIRQDHPQYRIAILHVSASWETVKARAESP